MVRRLAFGLAVLAALVVAPAAFAAFPGPYAVQGGQGVMSTDGSVRYVASKAAEGTLLSAISTKDGVVQRSRMFTTALGIPTLAVNGPGEGMTRDGSAFFIQTVGFDSASHFVLVSTRDLTPIDEFTLKGTFVFDALSPDGSRLYLIQHQTISDINHYVVRGYDMKAHRLLPARIADKAQRSWVMQGWAVNRAATPSGRWVYTLYANPGGTPFVHALDTVRGVAHCVGVPWPATQEQGALWQFTVAVTSNGFVVRREDGKPYRLINTHTWKVSKPTAR